MTALLITLLTIFSALFFGVCYRCRGGFLGTGSTTLARVLYWAAPVTIWGLCADWRVGLLCGVMAYVGLLVPHSAFQNNNSFVSVIGMACIGLTRLLLILLPLVYFYPNILLVWPLAMLQGIAYYIGWTFLNGVDSGISTTGFNLLGITFQGGKFAVTGSEWGEFLTGCVFGASLALILALIF